MPGVKVQAQSWVAWAKVREGPRRSIAYISVSILQANVAASNEATTYFPHQGFCARDPTCDGRWSSRIPSPSLVWLLGKSCKSKLVVASSWNHWKPPPKTPNGPSNSAPSLPPSPPMSSPAPPREGGRVDQRFSVLGRTGKTSIGGSSADLRHPSMQWWRWWGAQLGCWWVEDVLGTPWYMCYDDLWCVLMWHRSCANKDNMIINDNII